MLELLKIAWSVGMGGRIERTEYERAAFPPCDSLMSDLVIADVAKHEAAIRNRGLWKYCWQMDAEPNLRARCAC